MFNYRNPGNISRYVLVAACLFLVFFRITNINEKELGWDVLGYYISLPATFIYGDPMLKDIEWLKDVNEEQDLADTLYMITENDRGEKMYFFLFGMAFFYLPFFLIALLFSGISGYPVDGFSAPFIYLQVIGAIVYTVIGLIVLRKVLLKYFKDSIVSVVIVLLVFGTNYINHLTIKNLETVNILFMLTAIMLWSTIKWHETYRFKYMLLAGIVFTLTGLVKPSEVFVILIPLLWNITGISGFKRKLQLLYTYRKQLIITILICIPLALPQLFYWYIKTGNIFYDSYKNPGIGLDFLSPHIIDVLFSYRKGWLLYTPLMIFALAGFYNMFKQNRMIFFALFGYFIISFWVISSWTEWWYGASYSCRPVIALYPVLALSLGYFITWIYRQKPILKLIFTIVALILVALNQFQWWQYRNYILDPYRTTKEYYMAVFLKKHVPEEAKRLLLVHRDFSGKMEFKDRSDYTKIKLNLSTDTSIDNDSTIVIGPEDEFADLINIRYKDLTSTDHAWIVLSYYLEIIDSSHNHAPLTVFTMEHAGQSYAYKSYTNENNNISSELGFYYEHHYLTPELRKRNDKLKVYYWNNNKSHVRISSLQAHMYLK